VSPYRNHSLRLILLFGLLSTTISQVSQGGRYDQQIQQDVEKVLQSKSRFQNVHASTEDGIVTLTGTVKAYIDKLDAERRVRHVKHVEGVRNHIEVESTVPDDVLLKKLADKLRYDRIGYGIMFNSLKLNVENGVVTVSGDVRDYSARDSALAIIATEPGVKDVIDEINVLPASIYDDELRLRVARTIYGHPALQKYAIDPQAPIRIVVENGHVRLEGVVDTQMDKQIAGMQASSVPGVFSVQNNLIVAKEKSKE
jgi:hyperosmotically inducible periplasmic protein